MFSNIYEKLTKRQKLRLMGTMWLLVLGFLFMLLSSARPFFSLQGSISDKLFNYSTPSPVIVIGAIDDVTLGNYGRWALWPRSLHVKAINNLQQAGARAIGFDILFAEQTPEDEALARSMKESNNVVLSIAGVAPRPGGGATKLVYDRILLPTPSLLTGSVSLGHANLPPDKDGVIRRLPLFIEDVKGEQYPAFEIVVLSRFFNTGLPQQAMARDGYVELIRRRVPVDSKMDMRINYVVGKQAFKRISYKDILENNFDPELVKNKIVLVGVTATAETDFWSTPISLQKMPGVEIHAHAVDTFLRNRFLKEIPGPTDMQILALLTIILALSLPILNLSWGILLTVIILAGYTGLSFIAFDKGTVMNLLYPPTLLLALYGGNLAYHVYAERRTKTEIKELFGRYVSPEVTKEIIRLSNAGRLSLGGQLREVTIMFTDARGFTSKTEKMPAHELVETLNSHLEQIIEKVSSNGGIVNKFAGDNIMAIWNAPEDEPNHALLAIKTALESLEALGGMGSNLPESRKFDFGFGINTGEVIAGNMGAARRLEYTVIGDAVNLASRICSEAGGREVLIGQKTFELVQNDVVAEPLGPRSVKGKAEQVNVYRVKGLKQAK